jgi:hypothetical protein
MGPELDDLPHHDLTLDDAEIVDAVYFLAVQREQVDQFRDALVEV